MKTTYLVFENGIGSALRIASKEEWNKILADNRLVTREHRRFFIKDCFEDCGSMDCMYIETSKEEYDKWHSEYQVKYKKRKDAGDLEILSLDFTTQTEDESCLVNTLSDGANWEDNIIEEIRMKELRVKLAEWRSWANELLDYYLVGEQMSASKILSQKYGVSPQIIRQRKRELEKFIENFLK